MKHDEEHECKSDLEGGHFPAKVEGFLTLATDFLADHLGRLLSGKFRNGFSLNNCVSLHE